MLWNLNIMAELPKIQEVPRIVFPTLEELFKDIRARGDELPIWDDELYLEYHRGTLTSQEEVKRQNRQLEAHLHSCEWLMVIIESLFHVNISSLKKEIKKIWEVTLLCQFHDAIPGSSVNEANHEILKLGRPKLERLREIEMICGREIASRIRTVDREASSIFFNTLAHPRMICGQTIPSGGWSLRSENSLIATDEQITTAYEVIPKKGEDGDFAVHEIYEPFVHGSIAPQKNKNVYINAESRSVRTPFLHVIFSEDGTIASISDVETGREYLSGRGNAFELYEDRPLNWPAWDIQLYHKEMEIQGPIFDGFEFLEDQVTAKWHIERVGDGPAGTSMITQQITFSADSPIIDFTTVVNWTQHDKLLKVAFPTTIRSRFARFGIQFGHIQRPTHKNTLRDLAKFEAAGRWTDLSDSSHGVSLTSNVKAGFDVHEGVVRMSLLKSPLQTDKWADFGIRKSTYRLVCHAGGFEDSNITEFSDELNVPVVHIPYIQPETPIGELNVPVTATFVVVKDRKVILETLKPSFDGNGFVARFYESSGGWRKTKVTFPLLDGNGWTVRAVNLLEQKGDGKVVDRKELSLCFNVELGAFELLTVLIQRKERSN
jgi:alpha-mannosidase